MVAATGAQFPVVLDPHRAQTSAWTTSGFPTFLLDQKGVVRAILPGYRSVRPHATDILEALRGIQEGRP